MDIYIYKNNLIVKGPLGLDRVNLRRNITCVIYSQDKVIELYSNNKSILNTYTTLIKNTIIGVTTGYNTKLKIIGLGFRASVVENILYLKLGYSHLVKYSIPNDITITSIRPNLISINGINKQKINKVAAELKGFRKKDVYKGKGIHLFNDKIVNKELRNK